MEAKRVAVAVSILMCCAGIAVGQTEWEPHPDNPLIGPGAPGSFNARGNYIFAVVFDGIEYHMWFAGLDDVGPSNIGHATSPDGLPPWTMDPDNPVLTRGVPGEWDDEGMWTAAVIYDGTQFRMWYGGNDGQIIRTGYATSPDGSVWAKDYANNPVMDVGAPGSWDESGSGAWSVIVEDETYRMWFGGWGGTTVAIGYAESSDGINWTKFTDPVFEPSYDPGAWDGEAVGNFTVLVDDSTYHMFFVGASNISQAFGYAFSSNGIHWTRHPDNPVFQSATEVLWNPTVIFDGSLFHMWYTNWFSSVDWISYATSSCCAFWLFGDDFETGDKSLWSATVP